MSILQTQNFPFANNINEFKFDGATSFDQIRQTIKTYANDTGSTYKPSIYDRNNLKLLKKQLGIERQESMLNQLMAKNKENNVEDIGNNFNRQKFQLVERYNDMICIFFIHEASWLKQPLTPQQLGNQINNNSAWTQNRCQPTGIPYDIIFV